MILYESYWMQRCNICCVYIFWDNGNWQGISPYIKLGNGHVSHHTQAAKDKQIKYCLARCRVLFSVSDAILLKSILQTLDPAIEEVLEYLESTKRRVKGRSYVIGTSRRWSHGNSETDQQVSVRIPGERSAMPDYCTYVCSYNIACCWIIWYL